MDLLTMSENLSKFSKQLAIIQDYITLKFGVDFQEFYKSHSESQEDTDGFENAADLNLVEVASTSGNKNYLSNNAIATRLSMRNRRGTPVNPRSQEHTHSYASNSSIAKVLLEPIDVKTEDDFFNEMGGSSDDNMDDNDPLDQDFNAGGMEIFQEDSASGGDASVRSSSYISCARKRKRAKKKTPTAPPIETEPTGEHIDYGVRYGKTQMGQVKLIYENYTYRINKRDPVSERSYWRCVENCTGRLKLVSSNSKPEITIPHTHDPEPNVGDWRIIETDGQRRLLVGNDTYRIQRTKVAKSGRTYWKCIKKNCTGKLKHTPDGNIKIILPHNHDPPTIDTDVPLLNLNVSEIRTEVPLAELNTSEPFDHYR